MGTADGIQPVILCGGAGTRLWPASRRTFPKQFSRLIGNESLYQATLRRLSGPDLRPPVVVTHDDFRFLAADQAAEAGIRDSRILLEPVSRNTAPAILAAALLFADRPETLLLAAPSDHVFTAPERFLAALPAAAAAARAGQIVTFGVRPDRAATGYGYLEMSDSSGGPTAAVPVRRFIEKPPEQLAATLATDGRHLWNAGLFLFRAGDLLAAVRAHAPDLEAPCRSALDHAATDLGFLRLGREGYAAARAVSLDHAVMERAPNVAAVPIDAGWSDLGSWDAVWKAHGPDADGVATGGAATAIGCTDTLLRSEPEGPRLVGLGLSGIVAVATRDAVLVTAMGAVQDVGQAVAALQAAGHPQAEEYPRHHRPWGWFDTLCSGDRFHVKRIMVKPGGRLSLQSHVHRAEHWVVVQGTAKVTIGDTERLVTENQSVYIPLGEVHRLENPGRMPMYLIEVQTGAYLGEDDVTRIEDSYGRP